MTAILTNQTALSVNQIGRFTFFTFLNLVRGLNLDDENINTWKKGVERALKQYIPDGTKDESGQKCEKCKSTNLIYTEGCLICQDCGHGKCG